MARPPATRTIDTFMLNLRKYFEESSSKPVHFLSVRGMGYRFVRPGRLQPAEVQAVLRRPTRRRNGRSLGRCGNSWILAVALADSVQMLVDLPPIPTAQHRSGLEARQAEAFQKRLKPVLLAQQRCRAGRGRAA
jgi:hypothetical protein